MSGWLTGLGPAGTALSLLLLGHVLGDFAFQTDELAAAKHRIRPLLTHVGIVFVAHVVAFLPLLTAESALTVVAIGVVHFPIDAVSARIRQRRGSSAQLFLADQLAHLLVILGAWTLVEPAAWTLTPVLAGVGGLAALPWAQVTTGAVYLAAFVFAHDGGNAIVRGVLPDPDPAPNSEDELEAGSLIGSLERWVILFLGVAGLWGSVGLVVAAKSIARFEELKQQAFAEYFLVGTLSSVLVAIALASTVSVLV
ncbi:MULTISPECIES: DUF3307 domain-containing protein [Halolamina]|uniref:DUF3307 domain-containing protein n=1 Tax=Halolamina pelagica TaxID=699431 RepID=A0A1I5U0Z1_9EURY|nr:MULTISPECIES: DUF3307 domain-containing protein [Halolamina]NHX36743.1 DUF3307 domain-containing protein [Halolamina sp. R1-12]SFP88968.1 Protein of unknown function [Halolamina pelagica]